MWIWRPNFKKHVRHYKNCHSAAITSVDLEGALFATGSKDNLCTLWSLDLENTPTKLALVYNHLMKDEVLCVKFSQSGEQLVVGTTGRKASALNIFDVET